MNREILSQQHKPEHQEYFHFDQINCDTPKEAREAIQEAMEDGNYPVMTVPKQYTDQIKRGLVARATWIGTPILAGTLMRKPYLPDGEDRIVLKIKVDPSRVQPRFTGPDKHYHGVVVLKGPILPEEIEEIPFSELN